MLNDAQTNRIVMPDCPLAPLSRRTTYVRCFHRACMILGGVAPLAAKLNLAESVLRRWLDGMEEPTETAFLGAVEIILLDADAGAGRHS
jgi:hypothetical protein